jgi:hypothetical protein
MRPEILLHSTPCNCLDFLSPMEALLAGKLESVQGTPSSFKNKLNKHKHYS